MKVIFWDKIQETYERCEHVDQLTIGRDRRGKCYVCIKDGYEEWYKCSRFNIERVEREGIYE